jgi:hypothetical protein
MAYAALGFVAIVFAIIVVRNQLQQRRTASRRRSIAAQDVIYSADVDVKVMRDSGAWSRKTLGFMELVIRKNSIEISHTTSNLGGFLGNGWYFDAGETTIESTQAPSLSIYPREWIVLSGINDGKRCQLAIAAKGMLGEMWLELTSAGAQPVSLPPFIS